MAVAEALAPDPAWSLADLAAAPGGKTTHLVALVPDGAVVANELAPSRLRSLHDNLDLWGAGNVVTMSCSVERVADSGVRFDAAVLDAPCTGEALFRRDPAAIRHWGEAAVAGAARRQHELLAAAERLVKPGGVLIYSTCSFEVDENEAPVADLVERSGSWSIEDCVGRLGASPGVRYKRLPTDRSARLWPHRHPGEGQFVARLRRAGGSGSDHAGVGRPATGTTAMSGRRLRSGRPLDGQAHAQARPSSSARQVIEGWRVFQRDVVPEFEAPDSSLVVVGDRVSQGRGAIWRGASNRRAYTCAGRVCRWDGYVRVDSSRATLWLWSPARGSPSRRTIESSGGPTLPN